MHVSLRSEDSHNDAFESLHRRLRGHHTDTSEGPTPPPLTHQCLLRSHIGDSEGPTLAPLGPHTNASGSQPPVTPVTLRAPPASESTMPISKDSTGLLKILPALTCRPVKAHCWHHTVRYRPLRALCRSLRGPTGLLSIRISHQQLQGPHTQPSVNGVGLAPHQCLRHHNGVHVRASHQHLRGPTPAPLWFLHQCL